MKSKTAHKPYTQMNATELAQATREFDVPGYEPRFGRASTAEKTRHDAILRKIKRKRGRPLVGKGAKRIQVTMERSLLDRLDAYASRHHLARARLLAMGAQEVLAKVA